MGRELGGREGQANESTHLSIFLFEDTFTFFKWDEFVCFSFYSQYWLDKGPREIRNCCLCENLHLTIKGIRDAGSTADFRILEI